jgi:hypothetical protein
MTSQDFIHVLHFKDGTTMEGSTKRGNKKLKIRTTKKGKFQEVDLSTLDYATTTDKNDNVTTWSYVALKKGKKPRFMEIEYLGDNIILYVQRSGGGGGNGANAAPGVTASVGFTVVQYFVKRNNEDFATMVRSGTIMGKSFEKRAKAYFKDCKELTKQLGTEGFEKDDIKAVIQWYDENCVEQE